MMRGSTTIFTVKDATASLAYYRDYHLISAAQAPRPPGHGAVSIYVDDVDTLHADLVKRGARILNPPKDQDYGLRDFGIADTDGNMIFFATELKKS